MDLAEWLLAQIADDEQVARTASEALVNGGRTGTDDACVEARQHIYRFTPRRVLDECAAKRKLIERITEDVVGAEQYVDDYYRVSTDPPLVPASELMLRDMAAVYADRPGYRAEWKP